MVTFDGHNYESMEDIPDIGSWECVEAIGNKRKYWGMSADVDKLPKYDDMGTGSEALCLDTGDVYGYHAHTKQWHKL